MMHRIGKYNINDINRFIVCYLIKIFVIVNILIGNVILLLPLLSFCRSACYNAA